LTGVVQRLVQRQMVLRADIRAIGDVLCVG
jgi:hypothetical protein